MKVRAARLLDLAAIEQIHREAEARLSAVPPPARLWSVVSQTLSALLPLSQETLLYVAEEDGSLVGFVQASGQPVSLSVSAQNTVFQVLNLCVSGGRDEDAVAALLIEQLCEQTARRGVNRLFVRVRRDDGLLPCFLTQGFRQFATESVMYAESPRAAPAAPPDGLRAAKGRDLPQLYHLYRKVTPPSVAQLEAPTYRDWRPLQIGTGRRELVERGEVVAWYRLVAGDETRPATVSVMCVPEAALVEELADHVTAAVQSGSSWCSLRHYDALMIDALRGRGFSILLHQVLLVRELRLREPVAEQRLVPSFG
ncbi:MAG TPA: hypothetical protein VNI34_02450 [Candidatus Nitrosotalea sp.]|nr:hypothetical protein [Candidatus Nitrosotalea sp.]